MMILSFFLIFVEAKMDTVNFIYSKVSTVIIYSFKQAFYFDWFLK